ncbi:MAG TPA: hypothetical protein VL737_00245 [Candidatus Pristimantibacillus sp.]|jgi:diaminopimelate epimerase|nr:hypothetical protein [Candidatus Pristimantibacillus sp.]
MSTENSAGLFEAVPKYCTELEPNALGRVAVMYPSGNTTAVVVGEPRGANLKDLNAQIMQVWSADGNATEIEQCCYLTEPLDAQAVIRMEMFGGEFCGNATRSAIAFITKGRDSSGLVEVSGVGYPLQFEVKNGEVAVEMPIPGSGFVDRVDEGMLVNLEGISQLVVTEPQDRSARELLAGLLGQNKYGLAERPAVGVSYYDQPTGRANFSVWVKDVDTCFDETACGSGTSAIGIAAATAQGESVKLSVIQPSGEAIITEAEYSKALGAVVRSFIAGTVETLYDGPMRLGANLQNMPGEVVALAAGTPVRYIAEGLGAPEVGILPRAVR